MPPAPTAPWVLETSNYRWTAENGNTAFVSTCYDASTGFLNRQRTHLANGASDGASDLVVAFANDGHGNVATESDYGGDDQAVAVATGSANLCTIALPATPAYAIQHTYQGGVLASSRYLNPATGAPLSFFSLDRTIDVASGLVASSRDTAGLATTYSYDLMGRVTSTAPPGELATTDVYTRAAAGAQAAVDVTTSLTHKQILFDGLGRVWRETELMPDFWNVRETLYDGAGNKASVSELQTGNPVQKTQYLNYDPFGRATLIRPADSTTANGFLHDVTVTYAGVHSAARTVRVGTVAAAGGAVTETAATTTELYDRQGRLAQVAEPSGAGGAAVTTTYGYDVGSRLATVSTTAAGVTQTRAFAYDNRGLLDWEQHPEKGAAGNGTVSFLAYDARGHAHRRVDGPHDLTYTYDAAERVTEIDETGSRPLKTFSYATANVGSDAANGKLRTASRYNYPALSGTTYTSLVGQTYTYGGAGGRVSQRDLAHTFNGAASESFHQTFAYDGLGNLASLGYPQCTFAACSGVAASPRTLGFSYTRGYLTGVTGYTGTIAGKAAGIGISYSPNHLVNQVQHGNGILDTQANDPHAIARPAAISAAGTASWSSGSYVYDGAGNVTQIGGSTFVYDSVSRLTSAALALLPGGGGTPAAQGYGFDAFGNLQSVTVTDPHTTPTSSATNRLNGAGAAYDAAGNLTAWNGATYEYDDFDQLKHYVSGSQEWLYIYDADDERVWSFQPGVPGVSLRFDRWTLRDLGAKVLRTYEATGYNWTGSVAEDDIYRDGLLLAAEVPGQTRHFHLDHLGSPRLITDQAGAQVAFHAYFPFGEEATAFNQDSERLKFTGHERDLASLAGTGDDLDYMHARHCSPLTGRFLSVDPVGGTPGRPQSWNRYAYVGDNPMNDTDPTGRVTGSDIANKLTPALQNLKEDTTQACTTGGIIGVICATYAGAAFDATTGVANTVLRLGENSGEKIGSGAGPLAIGVAVGGDLATAVGLATLGTGSFTAIADRLLAPAAEAVEGAPSFFEGASYTSKVLQQMQGGVGEFHSFPESVTAFESAGTVRTVTGGDGVVRQVLEIPGSYGRGGNGVFQFIKNADGTINHRLFVPNSP